MVKLTFFPELELAGFKAEVQSSLLTLEAAVRKTISPKGPFRNCSRVFDHMTGSSLKDKDFSEGGEGFNQLEQEAETQTDEALWGNVTHMLEDERRNSFQTVPYFKNKQGDPVQRLLLESDGGSVFHPSYLPCVF